MMGLSWAAVTRPLPFAAILRLMIFFPFPEHLQFFIYPEPEVISSMSHGFSAIPASFGLLWPQRIAQTTRSACAAAASAR
jgi:hypothetical protein